MKTRSEFTLPLCVLLVTWCTLSCNKQDSSAAGSSSAAVTTAAVLSAPQGATPITGLDKCMVGNWRSTPATLSVKQVTVTGGSNISLKIQPSGATLVDFTPMSEMQGTSGMANFNFHYSGTVTGIMQTPRAGVITVAQSDYSKLRVTAAVKMGGASIPMFKDTPVASLAAMTGALATGVRTATQPSPTGANPGIDSSPVLTTDSYLCTPTTLTLMNSKSNGQWTFARSAG